MWILLLLEYFYRNNLKDFAFINYTGVCIIFNFTDSLEKAFGPHINSLRKRERDPSDDRKADGSLQPRSPAPAATPPQPRPPQPCPHSLPLIVCQGDALG